VPLFLVEMRKFLREAEGDFRLEDEKGKPPGSSNARTFDEALCSASSEIDHDVANREMMSLTARGGIFGLDDCERRHWTKFLQLRLDGIFIAGICEIQGGGCIVKGSSGVSL